MVLTTRPPNRCLSLSLSLSGLDVSLFHLQTHTTPIYHIQSNPNAKWLSVLDDEDANKELKMRQY